MKIIDVEQGTPEWLECRIGRPTCSEFDRIITPAQLKKSSGQAKYVGLLVAEYILGYPTRDFGSAYTDRGTALEPAAVAWYEFAHDVETTKVGFCLTDDERAGGSPDRLIGDDGILEIKVPGVDQHMLYVMDHDKGGSALEVDHRCQCQGLLWVTGRKWLDLVSWNPELPSVVVRVEPREDFQDALNAEMPAFLDRLDEMKRKYAPLRQARLKAAEVAAANDDSPF